MMLSFLVSVPFKHAAVSYAYIKCVMHLKLDVSGLDRANIGFWCNQLWIVIQ